MELLERLLNSYTDEEGRQFRHVCDVFRSIDAQLEMHQNGRTLRIYGADGVQLSDQGMRAVQRVFNRAGILADRQLGCVEIILGSWR